MVLRCRDGVVVSTSKEGRNDGVGLRSYPVQQKGVGIMAKLSPKTAAALEQEAAEVAATEDQPEADETTVDATPPVTRKPRAEVLKEAGIGGFTTEEIAQFPDGRIELARGLKGREGDGPCKVVRKHWIAPNGDILQIGDTLDPIEEKMEYPRYKQLVKRHYMTPDSDIETKLEQEWIKKSAERAKRKAAGIHKFTTQRDG